MSKIADHCSTNATGRYPSEEQTRGPAVLIRSSRLDAGTLLFLAVERICQLKANPSRRADAERRRLEALRGILTGALVVPAELVRSDPAFVRGARAAADVAAGYDASSVHDHRLGDCILGKLNLRARPPRRNRQRLDRPEDAWKRGFASGVAEMYGLLIDGGDAAGVQRVFRAAGLCLEDLRAAGVHATDLRRLRRAGVPARRDRPGGGG